MATINDNSESGLPTKVRITKCGRSSWWYANHVGQEYDVQLGSGNREHVVWEDYQKGWNYTWRYIAQEDCEIINTTNIKP
jgi:hypothetical protein